MYNDERDQLPADAGSAFTIEVLGEGRAAAAPDQATIQLGVVTEGMELKKLQEENAAATEAVIAALLAAGVQESQLQTVEFRMEPQYDYPDGQQVFRSYKLTHMLQLTTDRIDEAGALIDTAVANGANQVNSVQFTLSDPAAFYNEALTLAMSNARDKAETIAGSLGAQLSAVPRQVQELPVNSGGPVPFGAMMKVAADTSFMPGELTVKAAVRVWYWYE